jgi:hypothetical protein
LAGELLFEAREGKARRSDEEERIFRGADDLGHFGGVLGEYVVHRGLDVVGFEEGDGGVRLRVEVNQESFLFLEGQSGGEIDGGGGFADAAFLIGHRDYASQAVPLAPLGNRTPRCGGCGTNSHKR